MNTLKEVYNKDQAYLKVIKKEYEILKVYTSSQSYIIDHLNLQRFYKTMTYYNCLYFYHDQEDVLRPQLTGEILLKDCSISSIISICELSIVAKEDDVNKLIKIFDYYINTVRPKLLYLVSKFLLNDSNLSYNGGDVPF